MPTSTQPTTVGCNVRLVHQADQTGGRTKPCIHTGVPAALLNFAQRPPCPETSRLLGIFEAVQEGVEQRGNAQALVEMPPGSLPSETTALIFQGMQVYMEATPAPQVDAGAWSCMPSSSVQQENRLETGIAKKRAAGGGRDAGFMSPLIGIRHKKIGIQTLRALDAALTQDATLDVTGWARMNHFRTRTIRNYVCNGALTPEARNRLDVADGKASRIRKAGDADFRALREALADNPGLDLAGWARANHLHALTIKNAVHNCALKPEVQSRLDLADGKATSLRKVGVEDLRALRDAFALDRRLNVAEWARVNHLNPRTLDNYVSNGALTPEAQDRLDVADGKATSLRAVSEVDLRALRDAFALDRELNVAEWARANHLHSRTLENYVYKGALTPEAQNRLDVVDGKAPRLRRMGLDDLRVLRDALAHNSDLDLTAWARAHHLNSHTVRSFVRNGALSPQARERLQRAGGWPAELGRAVAETVPQASKSGRGVTPRDLQALREERASGGLFDLLEWAQRLGLKFHELIEYVTAEGEFTAKGLNLLTQR
ncbi:hypothetical protein [Pandoraea pulmonicola]|nr:hypothetical protein [Pandoraea pulmonicola]